MLSRNSETPDPSAALAAPVPVRPRIAPKPKPTGALGFGKYFTDRMFRMSFDGGRWHDAEIVPYAPIALDPAASVFHYGQAIFEGLKAYRLADGGIGLFRPQLNLERLNASAARLCMPPVDEAFVLAVLKQLVLAEEDWIPTAPGTALYLRPVMIATGVGLGVHASSSYLFYVICSPVGSYYEGGLAPIALKVEERYVRAVKGGTGRSKFAGNYASSILAAELARREGFDQVMWLDACEHAYVEEVGSMNIFFVLDGVAVTPALEGSILPGVTRRSCIEWLRANGRPVEERRVSVEEVLHGAESGALTEVFGTGTAAVISPVGTLGCHGKRYRVGDGSMGPVARALYDGLTGTQLGVLPDTLGWVERIR